MALGKRVAPSTCARAEILGCCSLPHAAPHSPQKSKLSPAPSCPLCVLLFDRLATSCQRCVQKLWPCHRANCMYLSVASTRARPGSRPALAARPCRTRGRARAQHSLVELVPQGRAGHDWALWLQALRQTSCATCALAASASLAPFRPGSPLPLGERVESRAAVVMLVCDRALHQHIAARGPCWPGLPYSGRQLVRSHTPPDTDHYEQRGQRPPQSPHREYCRPPSQHHQRVVRDDRHLHGASWCRWNSRAAGSTGRSLRWKA